MLYNKNLGRLGEDHACKVLKAKGYTIIDRNVYVAKGEIDIIAKHEDILIFVEVKTRAYEKYLDLLDSLDREKCERLSDICEEYLSVKRLENIDWRIDLIGIIARDGKVIKIQHFEGIV